MHTMGPVARADFDEFTLLEGYALLEQDRQEAERDRKSAYADVDPADLMESRRGADHLERVLEMDRKKRMARQK